MKPQQVMIVMIVCLYNQKEWKVTQDRNVEPAVTTTTKNPGIGADAVAIRHEPELRGGFKALRDRGIKITYYDERIG